MLTPLDDYLVHQTPETVDHVATSDRNFYDRYYFNAHTLDGDALLVIAMGLYPNVGVIDAFATVVIDNKTQYIVRASRALGSDRMNTSVGPISVEVLEGLRRMRVRVEPSEFDLSLDMTFEGAIEAYEEPHFFRRSGNRTVMDYTRLTQTGRWSGEMTVAGHRFKIDPSSWWGARDHSWGIRGLGGEQPSAPGANGVANGFFWVWTPMQFEQASMMFTCSEDADGTRWHTASELLYPLGSGKPAESLTVTGHDMRMRPGSRTFDGGTLLVARRDGTPGKVTMTPRSTIYMAGAGYAYRGGMWRHSEYRGPLAVEGETWDLQDAALLQRLEGQTETVCDITVEGLGELGTGHGILEFLLLGAYEPYGFKTWSDVASA